VRKDAYVRLGQAGPQAFGPAEVPGALLFIDVERGQGLADMRSVPHEIYSNVQYILVRLDEGEIATDSDILQARRCYVGKLAQQVGQPTRIASIRDSLPEGLEPEILRRARAIELTALLHWGRAIWEPTDHHYLLPSGRHAETFIKPANAIRGTRDAIVLARWIVYHFDCDDTGLVIDTGTLSAVALAVDSELRRVGRRLGRVVILEHYPRTAIDVQRAVYRAAGDLRRVVAILSVNSSGRLRDRLHTAMALPALALVKQAIEVLVDQSGSIARPPDLSIQGLDTWTPLEADRPLAQARTFDRNCELCRDARRSPIVTINPVTFEQEYLPQIKPVTPCFKDPERNHRFWECCSASNALALDEMPDSHAARYRPRGRRMAVHVRWDPLLENSDFMTEIVKEMRSERLAEHLSRDPDRSGVRLILVPQSDTDRPGFERLWGNIRGLLGADAYRAFPNEGEWGSDLLKEVQAANDIMVFSLGVVSGGTLQRARNIIQSNRHDSNYDKLRALVVHARASGAREWETLWNSFAKRIDAVWRCYLPTRSVLEDEGALLDLLDSAQLDDDEARFWESRRTLCTEGGVSSGSPIFWGSRPSDHLSPHSIYGDRLDVVTTFVAVGAAMEAKRHEKVLVPQRMVFDFRAITRSYYDPLILAAMLRWLLPYEQWWGAALPYEARPAESKPVDRVEGTATIVGELLWRADPEQRRILIPELLLAYALGKVPQMEAESAVSYARRFIHEYPDDVRVPMKLALRLAGKKREL
jgi:hypothetical protein